MQLATGINAIHPTPNTAPFPQAFAASGPQLLERLFEAHHRLVYGAAWRVTGNAADAEDVPALKGAGRGDLEGAGTDRAEGGSEQRDFGAAAERAGAGEDGELVEDERGILDEHRIGQVGGLREHGDGDAGGAQFGDVGRVLRVGAGEVELLPWQVRELAGGERAAEGADKAVGVGGEHAGEVAADFL